MSASDCSSNPILRRLGVVANEAGHYTPLNPIFCQGCFICGICPNIENAGKKPNIDPDFNLTVRGGYFEYGHALRDSRRPSHVLSDGTKPQLLEMAGSGCKLHLKWAGCLELPRPLYSTYCIGGAPKSIKPNQWAYGSSCQLSSPSDYRQGGVKGYSSLDYKAANAQTQNSLVHDARFTEDNYRTILGATTLSTFGCVGYMWCLHIARPPELHSLRGLRQCTWVQTKTTSARPSPGSLT